MNFTRSNLQEFIDAQPVVNTHSQLPQLTSRGAHKALHDLIEAGAADKIGWGCDTWTPEESYGSLLAFRQVLTEVLVDKVEGGYLSLISAREIARRILYENARVIYNLRSLKREIL